MNAELNQVMSSFFTSSRKNRQNLRKADKYIIIDDDEDTILFLTKVISSSKRQVASCGDIKSAKELLSREDKGNIACVVIDYYLPDGFGTEICEWLRKEYPAVPMFVYTSDSAIAEIIADVTPYATPVTKGQTADDVRTMLCIKD